MLAAINGVRRMVEVVNVAAAVMVALVAVVAVLAGMLTAMVSVNAKVVASARRRREHQAVFWFDRQAVIATKERGIKVMARGECKPPL
eukprot:3006981-Pleurochrysis_carterae.AAC.3